MPLPVPNLDDRTFDQLATEARSLIPKYFPEWTDHNPSDPGVTLLELFAFLFEIAIYQVNRVPERSLEHFAHLVGVERKPDEAIDETLRRALEKLQEVSRAVTAADIEFLVKIVADIQGIARAKAVVDVIDPTKETTILTVQTVNVVDGAIEVQAFNTGHFGLPYNSSVEVVGGNSNTRLAESVLSHQEAITRIIVQDTGGIAANSQLAVTPEPSVFPNEQIVNVIIVPDEPNSRAPTPTMELRQTVFEFLRTRSLITTRMRIASPEYDGLSIAVMVVRNRDSRLGSDALKQKIEQTIHKFLSPLSGGQNGSGWEFGRSVFRSELYQLIESIAEVDHVRWLALNGDETRNEVSLSSSTSLVRLDDDRLTVMVVDE